MTNQKPKHFVEIRNLLREYRTSGYTINHSVFESIKLNTDYTYRQILAVQKFIDDQPHLV